MLRWLSLGCLVGSVVGTGGCGRPPENVYNPGPCPVTGVVTLDGKPIAKAGEILFTFGDGAPPGHSTIHDGAFTLKTRAGKQRVEIFAFRPGKPIPGQPPPAPENYIPARYNS